MLSISPIYGHFMVLSIQGSHAHAFLGGVLFLVFGLLFGLLFSLPMGPIGILCLNRNIDYGFRNGLLSTLGMNLADCIYICIAGLGYSAVNLYIKDHFGWIKHLGIFALFCIGLLMLLPKKSGKTRESKASKSTHPAIHFISAFLLTLTNPAPFFIFISAFSYANSLFGKFSSTPPVWIMLGSMLGIISWWTGLNVIVHRHGQYISPEKLLAVRRISGVVIICICLIATFGTRFKLG